MGIFSMCFRGMEIKEPIGENKMKYLLLSLIITLTACATFTEDAEWERSDFQSGLIGDLEYAKHKGDLFAKNHYNEDAQMYNRCTDFTSEAAKYMSDPVFVTFMPRDMQFGKGKVLHQAVCQDYLCIDNGFISNGVFSIDDLKYMADAFDSEIVASNDQH